MCIRDRYRAALAALADTTIELVTEAPGARGVYHLAVVRAPQRDRMRRWLTALGVETGIHYPTPIHHLVPYAHLSGRPLPVAEQAADEVLSLPMFPHMTEEQVSQVCEAVAVANELLLTREEVGA